MKRKIALFIALVVLLGNVQIINALDITDTTIIRTYSDIVNGVNYNVKTYDNNNFYKVDYKDSSGEKHLGILNKESGILTVDGDVVEYSVSGPNKYEVIIPSVDQLASSDWTPIYVAGGYKISCSPIFKTLGYITTAIITAAGTVVGARLGNAVVGSIVGDALGNAVGDAVSKVNITFKYDLYRTKNPVYINSNAAVKTTGYRYQNYKMNATYKGKTYYKSTTLCGAWWTSSNPY